MPRVVRVALVTKTYTEYLSVQLVSVMTVGCLLGVSLGQGKYGAPYKGPPVVPVILPGGFLADTREVAAAKEYHLSAVAKAASDVKKPNGYYKPRSAPFNNIHIISG